MIHKIIIVIVSLLFIYSCEHQNINKCKSLYDNALDCWIQYTQTEDTLFLHKSNQYIDSIDCMPIKKKVFELKLALMFTMKDYNAGKRYIESFDMSDFGMPYKKKMYLLSFDAMILKSHGDTIQRQIYNDLVQDIQAYVNVNPNEESLRDLFMVKAKIESRADIIKEIEDIRSLKIYQDDFIDLLIKSMKTDNQWE